MTILSIKQRVFRIIQPSDGYWPSRVFDLVIMMLILWWAVATLTTVGYGDIYPITALGRFLGAIIAILGIGMVAIPTSILSSGFVEHFSRRIKSTAPTRCPHCGKELPHE